MATPSTLRIIKQACEQLQISRTKLHQLLNTRQLRRVKFGRATRILQRDLDRLAERGAQ